MRILFGYLAIAGMGVCLASHASENSPCETGQTAQSIYIKNKKPTDRVTQSEVMLGLLGVDSHYLGSALQNAPLNQLDIRVIETVKAHGNEIQGWLVSYCQ